MKTVFVAQSFSDQGDSFLHGVFSTPEKAEAAIKSKYPEVEMRPSPIKGSSLGHWYWQNDLATFSAMIDETEIQ